GRAERGGGCGRKKRAEAEADVAKARTRDHMRAARKLTKRVGDGRRFANDPPLIVVLEHLLPGERWHEIEAEILAMVESYRQTLAPELRDLFDQYRLVDIARKVVGVGSVGTRASIAL